jgi:hypothetical protein
MKKVLLLMVAVLMISSVAMADHISVYTDASASVCALGPAGFLQPVVVHKLSAGTLSSRFKMTMPGGSNLFGFNTPYVTVGSITSDLSVGYGVCLNGASVIGTLAGIFTPGTLDIVAADLQTTIIVTDCTAAEFPATGGTAYIGTTGDCHEPNATENSTWGQVKALYR